MDASVGGKTGVNNRFGKNLIGSFYQPRAVYCESKFLSTLPAREFAAGVAEAVKMAVCFDVELFKFFETHDLKSADEVSHVIARCVEIKAGVVERDERESGVRAVLNYGHTFAHAIEKITDYKKFLHGEAVAIGMVMANALARRLGKLSGEQEEQIRKVLQKFALPIKFHVEDADAFYELFFLDKKSENGKIKFILPDGIGKFYASKEIAKDEVITALKEFE